MSTNQHFASTFSMQIFKFQKRSNKLFFLFWLRCQQSAPESFLAGYSRFDTLLGFLCSIRPLSTSRFIFINRKNKSDIENYRPFLVLSGISNIQEPNIYDECANTLDYDLLYKCESHEGLLLWKVPNQISAKEIKRYVCTKSYLNRSVSTPLYRGEYSCSCSISFPSKIPSFSIQELQSGGIYIVDSTLNTFGSNSQSRGET